MGTPEQDLDRHLAEMDEADARERAEEAKVLGWKSDRPKIVEAMTELLENGEPADLAEWIGDVVFGRGSEKRNQFLIEKLEEAILAKFSEWAPDAVDEDIENAKIDEAEAKAAARADHWEDFDGP